MQPSLPYVETFREHHTIKNKEKIPSVKPIRAI